MKKQKVNFDEIQKAMEDVSRDTFDYFLDMVTGEVIAFSEEILSEVKKQNVKRRDIVRRGAARTKRFFQQVGSYFIPRKKSK